MAAVTRKERTRLVKAIAEANLPLLPPRDVPLPANGGPPVPYLSWSDKFICTVPRCLLMQWAQQSQDVVEEHCAQEHTELHTQAMASRAPLEPGNPGIGIHWAVLQTFSEPLKWH